MTSSSSWPMSACDIDAALSVIPSSENEIRLLTALRVAESTTRRLEAHSYQLQTTNIKNEQRIHQLEMELVGLRQLYDQREEMHSQREREWAQEVARKREIYLREEEARKKRNQEEAHDLWEKAVVSWEKEKEQTRKDIQAARAYNKQAEDGHQMLSIRVRLKLINGEVPPLVLRPIPRIPTKSALYDFLAAAAAKKD